MRRLAFLVPLLLLLVSCVPQIVPMAERVGDTVVITVDAETPLFDATLHVLNATTPDERCVPLGEDDVSCLLGDILPGEPVSVTVLGSIGAVDCILFGFSDATLSIASYRPYPCQIRGEI